MTDRKKAASVRSEVFAMRFDKQTMFILGRVAKDQNRSLGNLVETIIIKELKTTHITGEKESAWDTGCIAYNATLKEQKESK
jgi:hypothetical protein